MFVTKYQKKTFFLNINCNKFYCIIVKSKEIHGTENLTSEEFLASFTYVTLQHFKNLN